MAMRRKHSEEFKREAVGITKAAGVTVRQVAAELGVNANMLTRWGRELEASGTRAFPGRGKAQEEEMALLKRELARAKKERDFLKEAAAFFAKESS
jgi:transposase